MKKLFRYTAWNWSMGGVPAMILLGVGAVTECLLLIAAAGMVRNAWFSYDELVAKSGILWVAAIVYMLLPISTQLYQSATNRRANSAVTTLTLPLSRWQILLARTLSAGIWLIIAAAAQLVLLAVLWGPVIALQDSVASGYFFFDVTVQGRFWWDLADCELFRLLVPTSMVGTGIWLGLILAPALMTASVSCHSGRRQGIAAILALANQAAFAVMGVSVGAGSISISQIEMLGYNPATLSAFAVMAVVMILLTLWGLLALQRSEAAA